LAGDGVSQIPLVRQIDYLSKWSECVNAAALLESNPSETAPSVSSEIGTLESQQDDIQSVTISQLPQAVQADDL